MTGFRRVPKMGVCPNHRTYVFTKPDFPMLSPAFGGGNGNLSAPSAVKMLKFELFFYISPASAGEMRLSGSLRKNMVEKREKIPYNISSQNMDWRKRAPNLCRPGPSQASARKRGTDSAGSAGRVLPLYPSIRSVPPAGARAGGTGTGGRRQSTNALNRYKNGERCGESVVMI